jgi:lipopolysaccharide transport system ATP-binding protein
MTKNDRPIMLELNNVTLGFKFRKSAFENDIQQVLDSVSLNVYKSESLGIIGQNGVGKTTILRIMAGIIDATSGTVRRRHGTSAALLTIGLGFKPQLSGRDNAKLAAMLAGASSREAAVPLEDIKAFSELGDSFERPVKTYSSGMRSRLGFSTSLLTHVDTMLIDEVLSVGDAQFSEKAEKAIRKRISGDQTVVFVSHSEPQIRSICDRVIWLKEGRIASEGSPDEVFNDYNSYIQSASARIV